MLKNNKNLDFSVLMAVYYKDDPRLFMNALDSIIHNTIKPQKLVIIADGKLNAELYKIIDHYSKFIDLYFSELPTNFGLATALNIGLSHISTKYTIRADADDINYPNRFEVLIKKLDEGYDLVGSAIREVDKDGVPVAFRAPPKNYEEIRIFTKKRSPFNHMTVGFRTKLIQHAGGYPEIYLKEDYALWATLLSRGARVCNIDLVLVDATAGREMFQRRGGFKYALAEIDLQLHLVRCGIKNPLEALIDGLIRGFIFLAPNFLRQFIYMKYLRVVKFK